jgi:pyruvate/2-oxoglutarate dehydrogenase complex dihydrolipoamide dehydrogenase (E3) component
VDGFGLLGLRKLDDVPTRRRGNLQGSPGEGKIPAGFYADGLGSADLMTRRFDAIVIGAGQAGPSLAGRLSAAGMSVAIIERHLFGGTCVNTGCMPTKTLVASAYAAHLARRSAEYDVMLDMPPRIDMARVKARANAISANSRNGVESWLRGLKGCTVLKGHARFVAPDVVAVGEARLTAPRSFINVGGRALVPPLPGVDQVTYLTNSSMLALDRLPEHLIVVGGSYIGLEFAQMYRRFGAAVTVVEMNPRLIAREDEDTSQAIREILESEGVAIRTSAECIRLMPHAKGVMVGVQCTEGDPEIVGTDVLLAVGRRPNTNDLGLDKAGVAIDARGYIEVDDFLAASAPGIWALGECNGRGAFTHTAYNDFEIVAANLLDGETRKVSDRILGYALYIDPPLGRVGLTDTQARAGGRPLLGAQRPMSRVGRAIEKGETQGFMKVVVDAETQKILGAAILGVGGDEAIHGVVDIMNADMPYTMLRRAMPIHPTVSELIPTLLGDLRPIP